MKFAKKVSSAVKSKPSARKDTGYEQNQKKLKTFKYEDRVSPVRLAFERSKVFHDEMSRLTRPIRKFFIFDSSGNKLRAAGGLWASRFLSIKRVLRSSPLSLILHYCQSNLLYWTIPRNGTTTRLPTWVAVRVSSSETLQEE